MFQKQLIFQFKQLEALIFAGFLFPIAMIILHFHLQQQYKYELFYTSHHFTPYGRYELNTLTLLPMCGFIAQLVEHCTGIAEVTVRIPLKP